jgi:anti-sigma factor (TIGR02949 family)
MGEDCDALLQNIADYLHGELEPREAEHLRQHLEGCPPCFESADFQAQLRQIVAKRCFEQVPDDFKVRLVARLEFEAGRADP